MGSPEEIKIPVTQSERNNGDEARPRPNKTMKYDLSTIQNLIAAEAIKDAEEVTKEGVEK